MISETASTSKLRHLVESANGSDTLGQQVRDTIRQYLAENQVLVKGLQDRLRRTEEHLQLYERKHEDLEAVLAERNTAYEELLGKCHHGVAGMQLTRCCSAAIVGARWARGHRRNQGTPPCA